MSKHSKERQGRAIRARLVSKGNAVGSGGWGVANNRFMVWLSTKRGNQHDHAFAIGRRFHLQIAAGFSSRLSRHKR
jgi:hypothetical protein